MKPVRIVESYSSCGDIDVLLVAVRRGDEPEAWCEIEITGPDEFRAGAGLVLVELGLVPLAYLGDVHWIGTDEAEARTYHAEHER